MASRKDENRARDNVVRFASDHYEHAKLIVDRIVRQMQIIYVSRFNFKVFHCFILHVERESK